jgi:hypothetical protein
MVWKDHKKVAIGYHYVDGTNAEGKSYVVYWFCGGAKKSDFNAHRKQGDDDDEFVANKVGATCMLPNAAGDKYYNNCFNQA